MSHSIYDVIDYLHYHGCIVVIAHPFDIFSPFRQVGEYVRYVDAIEIANASITNYKTNLIKSIELLTRYSKVGYTAGSDSHIPQTIGDTILYYPNSLSSIDDIIDCIIKRKFFIIGRRSRFIYRLKKAQYSVINFISRLKKEKSSHLTILI